MQLAHCLAEYVRACFTGLWIESHEHPDALSEIAPLCRDENWRLAVWDIDRGLHIPGQENAEAGSGHINRQMTTLREELSDAVAELDNHCADLKSAARDRLGRLYNRLGPAGTAAQRGAIGQAPIAANGAPS